MTDVHEQARSNGRLISLNGERLFVVGDVHACFYTFKTIVEEHWNPENEILVQVGDLINRGPHSTLCVQYAKELSEKHPGRIFFLMGNHEYHLLSYLKGKPKFKWVRSGSSVLLKELAKKPERYSEMIRWISERPLAVETDFAFVSHAGLSKKARQPYKRSGEQSLINNRLALKKLKKIQIIGHVPNKDGQPVYNPISNSYRIDTSAWQGQKLTGLKFNKKGKLGEIVQLKTDERDVV